MLPKKPVATFTFNQKKQVKNEINVNSVDSTEWFFHSLFRKGIEKYDLLRQTISLALFGTSTFLAF